MFVVLISKMEKTSHFLLLLVIKMSLMFRTIERKPAYKTSRLVLVVTHV